MSGFTRITFKSEKSAPEAAQGAAPADPCNDTPGTPERATNALDPQTSDVRDMASN